MDILTVSLCMSIGCAVAWSMALFTRRGVDLLIWDMLFGMIGAALCAAAIAWIAPKWGVVGLVILGPPSSLLLIFAGHAAGRAIVDRRRPPG